MHETTHGTGSPVLYFPHGGGPMPLLGDPAHRNMVEFLARITPTLPVPSSILVISAHWEAPQPTITSGAHPSLIYDYFGFPEESYRIAYPAPGDPAMARAVHRMLADAGIDARMDERRGFDHGLFVPLKIMYPDAQIPCIQLSLVSGLDPATHVRMGRALAGLRAHNVLVIGSGFSFHNMRAFFSTKSGTRDLRNEAFQQWLIESCANEEMTRDAREGALVGWESAPHARYAHPREEHLMPLHVCCGLAGTAGTVVFDGEVLGKRAIGLLWR